MRFLILILIFFVFGGLLIIYNNNLALANPENVNSFSVEYISWLDQVYLNMQNIFGSVFGVDWFPRKI